MRYVQVRCENPDCNKFIRYDEVSPLEEAPKEKCQLCKIRDGDHPRRRYYWE